MDKRIIAEDVNKAIDKSEYKEFMSQAEIDKVHKLSLDPKYSQVPFDSLIIMSLAGRMPEI